MDAERRRCTQEEAGMEIEERGVTRRALLTAAAGLLYTNLFPSASESAPAAAPVWSVQFSPDGKTLAAGGYREVRLYDVSGKTLTRTLAGHSGPVRCLAWTADSAELAAGGGLPGELGEVRLWK